MLKRVVFIFKKGSMMSKIEKLLKELAAYQVETDIFWHDGESSPPEESEERNTLYITDCAKCYKELYDRKLPTVVCLHEHNRTEYFPRAEYAIENIEEIQYKSLELAYLRLTGQPWIITTTERCIIRESVVEDVNSFYEIYKEPSITEYMEDLYADRDVEIVYLQDYIKNVYSFYGYGMWTVIEKKSGQVIGRAGLSLREGYDIPELGFVIGAPWQGQGYAYEVCQAVLAYGREELDFQQFQALVMKGNKKSKRLCEKLGFAFWEDVEIDGMVYERMGVCYDD